MKNWRQSSWSRSIDGGRGASPGGQKPQAKASCRHSSMQSGRSPGWPVRWWCQARHTSPAPMNTHRTPSSSRGGGFRSVVVEALSSSCCCSSSPASRQRPRLEGIRKQRMCIMSSFGTGNPSANSPRGSKSSGWGPSSSLSIRPHYVRRKEEKCRISGRFSHPQVCAWASEVASWARSAQIGCNRPEKQSS
jgi:hypothetical protein